MDIPTFCKDETDKTLAEKLHGCQQIYDNILNLFSEPDTVSEITTMIREDELDQMTDEARSLMAGFLANALNMEIIKKEIFRREMENDARKN